MKVIGYNGFSDGHFKALIVELNPMEVQAVSALLPSEGFSPGHIKVGTEVDLGDALTSAVDNTALVQKVIDATSEAARRFDEIRQNMAMHVRSVLGKGGARLVEQVQKELDERDKKITNRLFALVAGDIGVPLTPILPVEVDQYNNFANKAYASATEAAAELQAVKLNTVTFKDLAKKKPAAKKAPARKPKGR